MEHHQAPSSATPPRDERLDPRDLISLLEAAHVACTASARDFAGRLLPALEPAASSDDPELAAFNADVLLIASTANPTLDCDVPSLMPLLRATRHRYLRLDRADAPSSVLAALDAVASLLHHTQQEITAAGTYQIALLSLAAAEGWCHGPRPEVSDAFALAAGIRAARREEVWHVAEHVTCREMLGIDPLVFRALARSTGHNQRLLGALAVGEVTVGDALSAASVLDG